MYMNENIIYELLYGSLYGYYYMDYTDQYNIENCKIIRLHRIVYP